MASVGHWYLHWQLPAEQIGQISQIEGQVTTLVHDAERVRFTLTSDKVNQQHRWFPPNIRLSWSNPAFAVKQGQRLHLSVRLRPAHGLGNEHTFNYRTWLLSQGIVATGYVLNDGNRLVRDQSSLRQWLSDRLTGFRLQHHSWLAALTLGDRQGFSQQQWLWIQRTGTAHLVAISGLHLGIVAATFYAVFQCLVVPFWLRVCPGQSMNFHVPGLCFSLFAAGSYAWLAGLAVPALRAWLMLLLVTILIIMRRYWRGPRVLLVAGFSFMLLFPMSIFSLSLWLTFAAVAMILFVLWRWPASHGGRGWLAGLGVFVRLQLVLNLLMLPVIAWQFSMVSVIAPLVNLIAVPLVTLILIPLCLIAMGLLLVSESAGRLAFVLLDGLLERGLGLIRWLGDDVWWGVTFRQIPLGAYICLAWAIIMCLLPRLPVRRGWLCILVLPFVSFWLPSRDNSWQLDVLDVGQGLAVMLQRQGRALIYDVGPAYPGGFNMADSVILPQLRAAGITRPDKVIISHYDNDHAGSLGRLMEQSDGVVVMDTASGCIAGQVLHWQDLTLSVLWPEGAVNTPTNGQSCVVHISDGKHAVLLTGDIDKQAEYQLIKRWQGMMNADVLVAPHHGSKTSSSEAFIRAVSPEYVVFSNGFENRWGFPHPEVAARYQIAGVKQLATASEGQIQIRASVAGELRLFTFRSHLAPQWYRF